MPRIVRIAAGQLGPSGTKAENAERIGAHGNGAPMINTPTCLTLIAMT